jgi:hypothetical protein
MYVNGLNWSQNALVDEVLNAFEAFIMRESGYREVH